MGEKNEPLVPPRSNLGVFPRSCTSSGGPELLHVGDLTVDTQRVSKGWSVRSVLMKESTPMDWGYSSIGMNGGTAIFERFGPLRTRCARKSIGTGLRKHAHPNS